MLKFNKIKRCLCLVLALVALFLASCTGGEGKSDKSDKIEILCTIYPQYDWVKSIVGDSENVEVSLLVGNGADVHGYQPSVDDVVRIKKSDAAVLVGGESDEWVRDALEGSEGTVIVLSEIEDIRLREVSSECIADEPEHGRGHEHSGVYDEHLWLSLANAKVACRTICEWLCLADEENAVYYRTNTEKYILKLESLEERFESIANGSDEPVIFADRFPLVYLFEDYGISYFAAFEGCTTDTEADFETVARLAKKLKETESKYIAVCESSDKKLAKSVIGAAGVECEIVAFDSMQSVTEKQIEDGYSYIEAMKANFNALSKIVK